MCECAKEWFACAFVLIAIIRCRPMLNGVKLKRIDTVKEVDQFFTFLERDRRILCVDTENTGFDWWTPNFGRLVQFGDKTEGWTISVKHWYGVIAEAFDYINERNLDVTAHNAKYDMHALRVSGFNVPGRHQWHDTFLMHVLLYPRENNGLKDAAEKLIDPRGGELSRALAKIMKQNKWTWATVPYELPLYSVYGGYDTVLGAALFELLEPQIKARFPEPYEVEMQTANIIYKVEQRGMRCDLDYCEKLVDKYAQENEVIAGKLSGYGITNPSSNDQIKRYLIEEEDWEPTVFTDKGNIVFNKDVKETLNYEIVDLCSAYAQRLRWSSYVSKMLSTHDNGILHPSIKTIEARTGRMSVGSDKKEKGTGKPVSIPFQQLPHVYEARRPILPRYEGWVLRPIDYDSQEIRVLAHYANCAGLIKAIQSGEDIHTFTAKMITGEDIQKSDPRRNVFKMNRYLQVYGGGVEKLALKAGITVAEAQRFKDLDNMMFPEIKRFMQQMQEIGKGHFHAEGRAYITSYGGREIEVDPPEYIKGELQEYFYKLANYIIQGSCADLLKQKLILIDSAGLTDYIDLPVHDELVTSVPDDEEGDEIAHEIKALMEELDDFVVPLTCELSKGYDNWGQKYLQKDEVAWDEVPV